MRSLIRISIRRLIEQLNKKPYNRPLQGIIDEARNAKKRGQRASLRLKQNQHVQKDRIKESRNESLKTLHFTCDFCDFCVRCSLFLYFTCDFCVFCVLALRSAVNALTQPRSHPDQPPDFENTENTEITSKIKENRKSNTEITEITSKMKGFQLFDSMLLYFTCDFDVFDFTLFLRSNFIACRFRDDGSAECVTLVAAIP